MKKILFAILVALFAVSLSAQTVTVAQKTYDWSADSTGYFEWYIDLPETVELDTTMQIAMWNYSSDGAVAITLLWAPAYHFTEKKRTTDYDVLTSVTLATSSSTESSPLVYRMELAAADTTLNESGVDVMPNAIYVKVDATSGNRADGYGKFVITAKKKEL